MSFSYRHPDLADKAKVRPNLSAQEAAALLERRRVVREIPTAATTPAHESMPGVHRVAALLQRWLLVTHHGAVQPGQLDYYLDEFVFRFNRRPSASRGLLFYRLLEQAVVTGPVTYQMVVGN
jgi:hypothetical protein